MGAVTADAQGTRAGMRGAKPGPVAFLGGEGCTSGRRLEKLS
jgi:hypothetical protein